MRTSKSEGDGVGESSGSEEEMFSSQSAAGEIKAVGLNMGLRIVRFCKANGWSLFLLFNHVKV